MRLGFFEVHSAGLVEFAHPAPLPSPSRPLLAPWYPEFRTTTKVLGFYGRIGHPSDDGAECFNQSMTERYQSTFLGESGSPNSKLTPDGEESATRRRKPSYIENNFHSNADRNDRQP